MQYVIFLIMTESIFENTIKWNVRIPKFTYNFIVQITSNLYMGKAGYNVLASSSIFLCYKSAVIFNFFEKIVLFVAVSQ